MEYIKMKMKKNIYIPEINLNREKKKNYRKVQTGEKKKLEKWKTWNLRKSKLYFIRLGINYLIFVSLQNHMLNLNNLFIVIMTVEL